MLPLLAHVRIWHLKRGNTYIWGYVQYEYNLYLHITVGRGTSGMRNAETPAYGWRADHPGGRIGIHAYAVGEGG